MYAVCKVMICMQRTIESKDQSKDQVRIQPAATPPPAPAGELNNSPIIEQVLALRQEKAKLLGFDSFAQLSMASKMATLDKAEELLEELRAASYDAAKKDMKVGRGRAAAGGELCCLLSSA
jgi:Zn-dependent oligopeptidase